MKKQLDLLSKFKMSGGRSHRIFDGSSVSILKQWTFILCLGIFLTAGSIWWSADRFTYWSNLEDRVAQEDVSGITYDQEAVRSILVDYEERAVKVESILNNTIPTVFEEVNSEGIEDGEMEVSSSDEISTTTATAPESN